MTLSEAYLVFLLGMFLMLMALIAKGEIQERIYISKEEKDER